MIIKPSKKILFSAIAVSMILHFFVCKIPVQSAIAEKKSYNAINISILNTVESKPQTEQQLVKKEIVKKAEKIVEPIKVKKANNVKKIVAKAPVKKVQKTAKKAKKKRVKKIASLAAIQAPVLNPSDFVKTTLPKYPRSAVRRGAEGQVMIKVKISPQGKPEKVKLQNSSGFSSLDNSALKAVSNWRFNASALNKSTQNWALVPVEFVIK